MDAGPAGRMWPYRLAVLALPLMVLWHQDNSLFTPPGQLDSWLYFGYFRDLVNFKRDLFPGTYYGSRLGWILPGWLVHTVFPPVFASAVLHLGVLWTASLALFETLRLTAGARAAFLTTLVFSANPQVWYAIGWDYVDGVGVAYCLLTFALFTAAAIRPGRRWMLVAAGATIAGMVYSNLLLTAFAVLLIFYYAGMAWSWRRPPLGSLLMDLVRAGGGFLLVTAIFCAVNYWLDGTFWFYRPTFQAVTDLDRQSPLAPQGWDSRGLMPWLWFAAVAVAAGVIQLVTRLRRRIAPQSAAPLLYSIQLLALLVMYDYLQRRRFSVLGLQFYCSYLLPFVFLVIGSAFWRGAAEMSQRAYVLLCGVAVIAFGTVWYDHAAEWTPTWPLAIWPVASIGALALAAALRWRRRTVGMLLAMAAFALFSAEVRLIPKERSSSAQPGGPHASRRMLERLMETRTWIEGERRNRMVRFWYDRSERPSEDYVALDATYLMYMLGNAPFPKLACDETIQPDTVVVIPSASAHVAGTAIGALSECASRAALRPNVAGSRTSAHPGGAYTTVLLTLDRDPSKWQHVRPVFDAPGKGALELTGYSAAPAAPFPPERWTAMYTDLGTQLHLGTDGTTLLTPKSAHAGAAFYGPLTAPAAGRYHFAMRFRPQSGVFAFGVGSGDGATWLATDVVGHRAGLDMERECWVDLEKGQEFRIGIANNNTVNIPASLVIKEITAWAIIGR